MFFSAQSNTKSVILFGATDQTQASIIPKINVHIQIMKATVFSPKTLMTLGALELERFAFESIFLNSKILSHYLDIKEPHKGNSRTWPKSNNRANCWGILHQLANKWPAVFNQGMVNFEANNDVWGYEERIVAQESEELFRNCHDVDGYIQQVT